MVRKSFKPQSARVNRTDSNRAENSKADTSRLLQRPTSRWDGSQVGRLSQRCD